MQKEFYQIAGKTDSRKIAEVLTKDGQLLLPLLELICKTEQAVDELIDVVGKAAIEVVLVLSRSPGPNSRARQKVTSVGMAGNRELFLCRSGSFVLSLKLDQFSGGMAFIAPSSIQHRASSIEYPVSSIKSRATSNGRSISY